ncbi:SDR family NAD(P)-dependent oxidoreductase [Streptomyces sp. MS06]|uniref:SDR family NAD(P)-dependent oxidoreductase n=1 Tax=Streptomyces sp. MS06 TaxID=3385974 RepID=UPI0039A2B37C
MGIDHGRTDLRDRVVLVTGATSGIGRATATALAARNATVVLVGRSPARAEATRREIVAGTGNTAIDVVVADLSEQGSVRRLAARVTERHRSLHVLINNAGITNPRRLQTADGMEETLAVNHLAPFLLTDLLLPALHAAGAARVITLTSAAFRMGRIDLDDLHSTRRYGQHRAYNQSKLANILFTRELARRLQSTPAPDGPPLGSVSATAVEPGFVRTGMTPPFPFNLAGFLRTTPQKAARAVVRLAAADDLADHNGVLFAHTGRPIRPTGRAADPELARRLWDASTELTAGGDDR